MTANRYMINHRVLIRMQRNGYVFCAVCHEPIVEGQRVVWVGSDAVLHEACVTAVAKKKNQPIPM